MLRLYICIYLYNIRIYTYIYILQFILQNKLEENPYFRHSAHRYSSIRQRTNMILSINESWEFARLHLVAKYDTNYYSFKYCRFPTRTCRKRNIANQIIYNLMNSTAHKYCTWHYLNSPWQVIGARSLHNWDLYILLPLPDIVSKSRTDCRGDCCSIYI